MAQQTKVTILDDIDGTEGAQSVAFSYEGQSYEIDLGDKNREVLVKALQPYIDAGRKVGGGRSRSGGAAPRTRAGNADTTAIREWAKANGITVNERGRIADSVRQQYEAAKA
ncbi:Lsr2 family protein [Cellulomonas sp. ATA003]|uniref:histone-like nucleoid-structuring protein Lsr2 n=1 Tax=Cellulomonas sp. ATA003 TaxID=3073064 RepID=UPI002872BFE7|nr:Lsr2 family protein [Cellulomonas sp. ATA003]WNB84292.1 Lsr2 family protein [Cellulomonas sp. ATA003]